MIIVNVAQTILTMSYETITSFTDIIDHTHKNTLVILDVDETILRLANEIGTKHWWNTVYNGYLSEHGDHTRADEQAFERWREHATECEAEHTDESGLMRLVEEARSAGNKIIAVTARSPEMSTATKRHLECIGIELDAIHVNGICFNSDGVFYAGDTPKSEVIIDIKEYLQNSGMSIVRIVFVDDIEKNVASVAEALDSSNVVGHCYLAKF